MVSLTYSGFKGRLTGLELPLVLLSGCRSDVCPPPAFMNLSQLPQLHRDHPEQPCHAISLSFRACRWHPIRLHVPTCIQLAWVLSNLLLSNQERLVLLVKTKVKKASGTLTFSMPFVTRYPAPVRAGCAQQEMTFSHMGWVKTWKT